MKNTHTNQTGFTLIELSIVLVIIGLLVGGIIIGKDMIRSAQLKSAMSDIETIIAATRSFKDKFKALPGDMPNATDFWGTRASCPGPASGTRTCNGNGNERVDNGSIAPGHLEQYIFWHHLSNAGLYPTNLTGRSGRFEPGIDGTVCISFEDCAIPGLNVPASPVGGGYEIMHRADTTVDAVYASDKSGHYIHFGSSRDGWGLLNPAISISEAMRIDEKYDDGFPRSGNIFGSSPAIQDCYPNRNMGFWTNPANTPTWGGSDLESIKCTISIYTEL